MYIYVDIIIPWRIDLIVSDLNMELYVDLQSEKTNRVASMDTTVWERPLSKISSSSIIGVKLEI